jgi:putative hydrolase of the HAD superfamily
VTGLVDQVLFDLDGTLFEHRAAALAGLQGWLPSLAVEPTDVLVRAWFDAAERHATAWQLGEVTFGEQLRRRLREFLPIIAQPVGDDHSLDRVFGAPAARAGQAGPPRAR